MRSSNKDKTRSPMTRRQLTQRTDFTHITRRNRTGTQHFRNSRDQRDTAANRPDLNAHMGRAFAGTDTGHMGWPMVFPTDAPQTRKTFEAGRNAPRQTWEPRHCSGLELTHYGRWPITLAVDANSEGDGAGGILYWAAPFPIPFRSLQFLGLFRRRGSFAVAFGQRKGRNRWRTRYFA
jgi:hypothetical protein